MFNYQDYPKDKRELIILDDSKQSNKDIIDKLNVDNNIRYLYSSEKINIGKKRNQLNKLAYGEYIVCFDDDDYYPPNRISHAINRMIKTKCNLAGSSIMHIYFSDIDRIFKFGPYGDYHATNGTLAYHKSYLEKNSYDDNDVKAEEKKFLNGYKNKMTQLDTFKTILCIAHKSNTVDKKPIVYTGKRCYLQLTSFIQNFRLLEFYKNLK